jgi:SulP family sulfate permease
VFDQPERRRDTPEAWWNALVPTGPPTHRSLREPRSFRAETLLPGLRTLRGYERGWLRGDVLAGITVAAYLVPQVMAYAQVAGLPPAYGLFGVIGPAVAYFLLGTSQRLSVGPESTTALMTASAIATLGASGSADVTALAAALAVVVGILCVVGWFGGLGFVADLLSKPVLVGYMAGVAGLMILSQVSKVTGIPASGESLQAMVTSTARHLGEVHAPTLWLSLALLAYLFAAGRLMRTAPNALIAVLLGSVAVAVLGLEDRGVQVIGPIPSGLPVPDLPGLTWDSVGAMLLPAVAIAIVGYSDNILSARAFARPGDAPLDANQELLALGAANVSAGVMGGFAVSSSASRTAIGMAVGARSQAYMLVCATSVVAVVLFLRGILEHFPRAALGALVVYAATRLIEWPEIRRVARFRRSELVLMVATTVGVLTIGVLGGILLAVGLSLGDLLRRVARPHDGILGYVPGLGGMHDIDDYPTARQVPGLVVYRYDSPMFFANADDFRERALAAVAEAVQPVHWLLVNAEANAEVDLTSTDAIEQLRETLARSDVALALARVKHELHVELERAGLTQAIGEDRIFETLPQAVAAYVEWHRETFGTLPPGVESAPRPSRPAGLEGPEGPPTP